MHRSRSNFASLLFVALAVAPVPVLAQTTAVEWADSARCAIEAANLAGNLDGLIAARALVERALTRFNEDPWLLHYRGYALYREATLRQGRYGEKDIDAYLEQAEASLKASTAKLNAPEGWALLSSVIGQQIGSNPLKGMTHGPRSNDAMDRAVKAGEHNPRVWLLRGISAMFTPKMFGGGEERAEEYLRRSLTLFENDKATPPAPAWGHDEAWVWLGQLLEKKGQQAEARAAYEKALQLEPRNAWARENVKLKSY